MRRASLIVAAMDVMEWRMGDLKMIDFFDGQPDEDRTEESFVYGCFAERQRRSYGERFPRRSSGALSGAWR
jgi:hypothetical protein